jgi:hypothetical protein
VPNPASKDQSFFGSLFVFHPGPTGKPPKKSDRQSFMRKGAPLYRQTPANQDLLFEECHLPTREGSLERR